MNFEEATDKELILARDHRATLFLAMRLTDRLAGAMNEGTAVARKLESLTRWLLWMTGVLGLIGIGAIIATVAAN